LYASAALRACEEPVELQLGGGDVAAARRLVTWLRDVLTPT
jgi:hypothetical protein